MSRIYLDYAASTPVRKEAKEEMMKYLDSSFGNAGSLHSYGQEAINALDVSRERMAELLGANFRQIIFTSSATESNNLAILGSLKKCLLGKPRLITTVVEHESILRSFEEAEKNGAEVVYLPVDKDGMVSPKDLKSVLNDRTFLVSIMYANNEIGTLEPIKELCSLVKDFNSTILFHTDASQAFQFESCDTRDLGIDMLTLSSHKIYGPKGAALLYINDPSIISPLIVGGGQEFGIRSGTENIPAITAFAKAAELAHLERSSTRSRILELSRNIMKELFLLGAELNGPGLNDFHRLPNILNIHFKGISSEELLVKFDMEGVAISAGSACKTRSPEPSHVLKSIGSDDVRSRSSIRISLGVPTTEEEVSRFLDIAKKVIN